jgi:hypothetical protein
MRLCISLLAIVVLMLVASGHRDGIVGAASAPPPTMGFFVTSAKNKTANLGGLAGRGSPLPNPGSRRGARRQDMASLLERGARS